MARYALINQDGKVINIIIWEEEKKWGPPQNHVVVKTDKAQRGDIYDFEKETFSTVGS